MTEPQNEFDILLDIHKEIQDLNDKVMPGATLELYLRDIVFYLKRIEKNTRNKKRNRDDDD